MSFIKLNQLLSASFARTSPANKQDGTTAASGIVRYEDMTNPIVVDKTRLWDRGTYTRTISAFNLLTANQSSAETDTTGCVSSGGGTITVTRDLTTSVFGSACFKVVTNGGAANQGCVIGGVNVVPSSTYTVSAYVKGTGTILPVLLRRDASSTYLGQTNGTAFDLNPSNWTRVSVTATVSSTTYKVDLQLIASGTQSLTMYIDGAQIELGSFPTPWRMGGTDDLCFSSSPVFTRASSGYILSTPYVVNTPRFVSGGILIEESTSNLYRWSEDFSNASWAKNRVTITADATTAPDGTMTADKMVEDNSVTLSHQVTQTILTVGQPGSASVYAKAAERTWIAIQLGSTGIAYFDLANGVMGTNTASNAEMTAVGNGWYRCSVSYTSVPTNGSATIYLASGNGTVAYTGDNTSGVYLWGAMAEVRSYSTSYYPNPSSSTVSRSADSLTVPAANVLSVASGSIIIRAYVDGDMIRATDITQHTLFSSTSTAGFNGIQVRATAGTPAIWNVLYSNAGSSTSTSNYQGVVSKGWHTFGIRWNASRIGLWIDGVERSFTANPTLLPVAIQDTFRIGARTDGALGWNNPIGETNIFNTYLTDSEMAAYTAASGAVIPMRSDTTWKATFNNNLNFATSGIYVSEWFNMGASGNLITSTAAVNNAASGSVFLYEYQTSDSDTQTTTSAWVTDATTITGKYVRFRATMANDITQSTLPVTTSVTITPTSSGKSATIEEGTVNLFAAPAVPVAEEIAVTAGSSYDLSFYGNDASSGSVVIEHKKFIDTQADFDAAATYTNAQSLASGAIALTTHADPTFTRATSATKRDGTTVTSGNLRYEDVIRNALFTTMGDFAAGTNVQTYPSPGGTLNHGQIFDGFDVDSSFAYTSACTTGVVTATFNTGSSRLELSNSLNAGGYSVLTYNNFTGKDVAIEVTTTQAQDGGILARFADQNNFYMLAIRDDSSATPATNLVLYKRVAGTFTTLATADVTFVRGVSHTVRFEIVGTELKGYYDGVLSININDSAISAAGYTGFYSNHQTAFYVTSFTIDQLSPLFARASVATSITNGTSIARNLPRYENGRNLCTLNQSNVETNLTGIASIAATNTIDATEFWQGTHSLKCVTNNAGANEGWSMDLNLSGRIMNNGAMVGSAYVKGTGTVYFLLRFTYDDATTSQAQSSNVTLTGSYQRLSVSATPTAGKGISAVSIFVRTSSQQAATFYSDGMQVEYGSTPTTWNAGGPSALMVEQATTNILPTSTENFTTNWSNFGGETVTVTGTQADPFGGTGAYRLQGDGFGSNTLKRLVNYGTSTNAVAYSTSVWAKNNSATTSAKVTTLLGGSPITLAVGSGWTLCKIQNTVGNGSTAVQLRFETVLAGDILDVTVMNPQIEAKAYCTTYIAPNSARALEKYEIPTSVFASGVASGSIIVRAYLDGDNQSATPVDYHYLFDSRDGGGANGVYLRHNATTGTYTFGVAGGSTTAISTGALGLGVGWHTFAIRWSALRLSIYVDGVERAFAASPSALPNMTNPLWFGTVNNATGGHWDNPIDEFNYFPMYLSDADMVSFSNL